MSKVSEPEYRELQVLFRKTLDGTTNDFRRIEFLLSLTLWASNRYYKEASIYHLGWTQYPLQVIATSTDAYGR